MKRLLLILLMLACILVSAKSAEARMFIVVDFGYRPSEYVEQDVYVNVVVPPYAYQTPYYADYYRYPYRYGGYYYQPSYSYGYRYPSRHYRPYYNHRPYHYNHRPHRPHHHRPQNHRPQHHRPHGKIR